MKLKKIFRRTLRAVRLQIENTAREVQVVRRFVARQLTPPPRPAPPKARPKARPKAPAAQRRRDDRLLAELLGGAAPDAPGAALDLAAWGISNVSRPDVRSVVDRLLAAAPGTADADQAWRDYLQLHGGPRRRRPARRAAGTRAPAKPKPVQVRAYQKGDGTAVTRYRRGKGR
ncbi:MAG: hypothetical protein IPO81_09685 [Kouleothrix sp.]|nr:hypothetical protein [Kouleothrix sp.]